MSRYAGRLPRGYAKAVAMLNGRERRTIANNTTLERVRDDMIRVTYHRNTIAEFHETGGRMLTNAGWGTVSTRERLNAMSPAGVSFVQRDHSQKVLICSGGQVSRVIDGGTVWLDGEDNVIG